MGIGAAVIGAAAIGGVSSLASGMIGADAAKQASDAQVAQDQQALATQVSATNAGLAVQAPFVDVGTGAAHDLADLYGISYAAQPSGTTGPGGIAVPYNSNAGKASAGGASVEAAAQQKFMSSPDYQFAFTQGLQALRRSAAASGTLESGGQVKAATEFGQGLASQQYGNYYNRLLGLANMGSGAANSTTTAALAGGNSVANTQMGIGTAQASGIVGGANALTGALGGLSSSAQTALLLRGLGGQSSSAYSLSNPAIGAPTQLPSAANDNWGLDTLTAPGMVA